MKLARLVFLTLIISTLCAAQTKPAPQLSEEVKARLLSEYKSVLLAQQAVTIAQQKVKDRVDSFNVDYLKIQAGLPKGSQIAVNPDTDTVEVTAPKEEAKPTDPQLKDAKPEPVKK